MDNVMGTHNNALLKQIIAILSMSSRQPPRPFWLCCGLCVGLEVIENGLPTGTLHFFRILVLGVKPLNNLGHSIDFLKRNLNFTSILSIHLIRNHAIWLHNVVRTTKNKARASVLRSHGRGKSSSYSQIVFCSRTLPIIGSKIPAHNMLWLCPDFPGVLDRSVNQSFDGNHI